MTPEFEPVIGLEVHAQLLTRTKIFCGCPTAFGSAPNTNVCPVCLGLPGSLPVLNREAVRMAVRIGLALGCSVNERSIFARKNYFYPDLPKGYQISQFDQPLCSEGGLDVAVGDAASRKVGIVRVHMEEDAGKNLHGVEGLSVVDLNRAGIPLVEIVGAPDLRSSAEAAEYLRRLREVLMALGVNDGNLEEGSFRCDANVSVRRKGETALGTRCEIKNVNSFRFVRPRSSRPVEPLCKRPGGGTKPKARPSHSVPRKRRTTIDTSPSQIFRPSWSTARSSRNSDARSKSCRLRCVRVSSPSWASLRMRRPCSPCIPRWRGSSRKRPACMAMR
jgi:hypothetical protein